MVKNYNESIPVFPHGLVIAGAGQAPFILFKDSSKSLSFPLWLPYNPIKMKHNISVSNFFRAPAHLSVEILKSFNFKASHCIFTEVRSGVQWAKLVLEQQQPQPSKKQKEEMKKASKLSKAEVDLEEEALLLAPEIKILNLMAYEAFSIATLDAEVKYCASDSFIKDTREEEIKDIHNMDFNHEKTMRRHGQKYLM